MKKIILFILIIFYQLNAQVGNQSQSIELPDFVITGKENITIPKMNKQMPDFIPLLSNDFFTPESPNDEKMSVDLPKVETEIVNLEDNKQLNNAFLKLNAGIHTWPQGEFYYNNWSGNFSYSAHLFGKKELEYIKNAGVNQAGIKLSSAYVINQASDFLPGLNINLSGKYFYDSFNFFGSDKPNLERITNNGYADFTLNYLSSDIHKFGININDLYYEQKNDELDENIFGTNAFYKLMIDGFLFEFGGAYKNQSVSVLPNSAFTQIPKNAYYFNSKALVGFKYKGFNLLGGLYFSESEGNSFFSPIAFGSIKLNNYFTLFGEFSPDAEFKTLYDFKNFNRYYALNDFMNLFVENKIKMNFAIRFEYDKYFEINAGLGYLNSDNNYYFNDEITRGLFTIHREDIENKFAYLNMLFRKGPFGEFYGELKINEIIGETEKRIPYSSIILGNFKYSYNWENGFGLSLGMKYFGSAFTDYENKEKIPEAVNITTSFYYELFQNFRLTLDFENLVNDKYYYFRNYEAKPFDALLGFEFRW